MKFVVAPLSRSAVVFTDRLSPVKVIGMCKCDDSLFISYMFPICSTSNLLLCVPALTVSSVDRIKNPRFVCHLSIFSIRRILFFRRCCRQWLRFLPSPSPGGSSLTCVLFRYTYSILSCLNFG